MSERDESTRRDIDLLVKIASDMAKTAVALHGSCEGLCCEVCLAALFQARLEIGSGLLAYGQIHLDDKSHPHHWIRYQGWIIDPTRSQFSDTDEIKVLARTDPEAQVYEETHYTFIRTKKILPLMTRSLDP